MYGAYIQHYYNIYLQYVYTTILHNIYMLTKYVYLQQIAIYSYSVGNVDKNPSSKHEHK